MTRSASVTSERPDRDLVALLADVGEIALEVVDVDEVLGRSQPQLHHRQQAVAARDDPRLWAETLQQRDGVVDARRALVFERCRNLHALSPFRRSLAADPPTVRRSPSMPT
jgi:hypothetical protein